MCFCWVLELTDWTDNKIVGKKWRAWLPAGWPGDSVYSLHSVQHRTCCSRWLWLALVLTERLKHWINWRCWSLCLPRASYSVLDWDATTRKKHMVLSKWSSVGFVLNINRGFEWVLTHISTGISLLLKYVGDREHTIWKRLHINVAC